MLIDKATEVEIIQRSGRKAILDRRFLSQIQLPIKDADEFPTFCPSCGHRRQVQSVVPSTTHAIVVGVGQID